MTKLLTAALISGVVSAQIAHAEDKTQEAQSKQISENKCQGQKAENNCKGHTQKKKKKSNSCSQGCGTKTENKDESK